MCAAAHIYQHVTRNVWEQKSRSTKGMRKSHKPTHEYSQLHDKVEVRFAFKDLFQGNNVCMFNPAESKKKECRTSNQWYSLHWQIISTRWGPTTHTANSTLVGQTCPSRKYQSNQHRQLHNLCHGNPFHLSICGGLLGVETFPGVIVRTSVNSVWWCWPLSTPEGVTGQQNRQIRTSYNMTASDSTNQGQNSLITLLCIHK